MWLTIRSGRSGDKTVEITGPVMIGRSEVCQVILDDPAAGRRHAHIRPGPDGTLVLQDLGSGSGTYVDGQPADGEVLLRGDETLRIGDTLILLSRAKPGAGGATNCGVDRKIATEPAPAKPAATTSSMRSTSAHAGSETNSTSTVPILASARHSSNVRWPAPVIGDAL